MGKGTDKLYITHSEWASSDAFSASAGSGIRPDTSSHAAFKRLPFSFCALSLQPFKIPVCTPEGIIFDHENIIRWLMKHNTNPVNGKPVKKSDIIRLIFTKNDAEEYVDPVTYKVLTDNTHIVAIRHGDTANVFAFETIERLNIKTKTWKDLVSDEAFSRTDIVTLQDPQSLESRNLNSFKYLKDGEDAGIDKDGQTINTGAIESVSDLKIMKAKEAVAKARAAKEVGIPSQSKPQVRRNLQTNALHNKSTTTPYNASRHTTGQAAASLTSTGVTPHTSGALALMTDEEYLLKRGRVKQKGYARLSTSTGDLKIELYPEHAPKAVWNFIRLSQNGYYNGVIFHRNIRKFMIQSGDPTGTGRGGTSVWGKNFEDEFGGPLKHDARGTVSMANKGKNTNSSQFFISYGAAAHLDRKHTIFGKVVDGFDALKRLEETPVDSSDRPKDEVKILEAIVFIDPFQEFLQKKRDAEEAGGEKHATRQTADGADDKTTWTGKRVREDGSILSEGTEIGKYLRTAAKSYEGDDTFEFIDEIEEPVRKKGKGGGFGNFDNW